MVITANYFVQADQSDNPANPSDMLCSLVDGIALLGHATADLSTLSPTSLKQAVKHALPFGSDFTKVLKEA